MTSENAPSSSRSSNGPWQPPALEEIQALFPQYEIVALLGRGGMGAVYKGWQRSLDRFVAIKILPPGLTDDPQYSERFKQEAKSMAKLAHAGIVAVFDAGELANGMLYFVMEFIEGTDVQKMIAEQGSLPPAHAMAITAHVCDALQYAHDRGIIHRDIKPANIMVGYDGVVKVADFGLAKQQQEGVSGLTQSGMVMGTLHYMAPESLILGVSVDHRADIYAVGIMLYQMLTGRLPQGLFEMPSQKVPGLDPRYDAVVAKAIREDRDIRYQSAAELRADLDSILTQPVVKVDPAATQAPAALPTVARPQRPQGYVQRAPQPVPKKSSSTGILLVAALVLAAGGFFVFKDKLMPGAAPAPAQSVTAETPKADPATPAPSAEETIKKDTAATTPASPTAKPASMAVATPKIETSAPKPATPQTELEKRIAALETGFQNAAKAEPEQVFQQSMAALNKSYLAALDRALATATQKGELDDAVALREEKQRMEKGSAVPSLLEEGTLVTPVRETLKKLRDTYRSTQLQHETTKARAISVLYDKYSQALATIQADLTKAKQLDEALKVKPVLEQINQRKAAVLRGIVSTTSAAPVSAVTSKAPNSVVINSLGMKFVPVPGANVLFCVHETRYKDYAAYAAENPGVDDSWKDQEEDGFTPPGNTEDHPVVRVNWDDAQKFCAWLSRKEGKTYRLPTDREWSHAVGIGQEEQWTQDTTPSIVNKNPTAFPWGGPWPPPKAVGNFSDESRKAKVTKSDVKYLVGYDDGFPTTAPVMSFQPNKFGLYDLDGNVREWVEDWYDTTKRTRVLRGGSWLFDNVAGLLSSSRAHLTPAIRGPGGGFRIVVAAPTAAPAVPSQPVSVAAAPGTSPQPAAAVVTGGFTNSLGMKLVSVPGTDVLMCIHETRRKDFEAFASEVSSIGDKWKQASAKGVPCGHENDHPVVGVSWNDAKAFCSWLSKKEGRKYELPTDQEWSLAVGLDEKRGASTTPDELNGKVQGHYPWGAQWPPPTHVGNYEDEAAWKAGVKTRAKESIPYDDGYPTTAPAMSFPPNSLGIYDLGGNVYEWCDDWINTTNTKKVVRGASWFLFHPVWLLSSGRNAYEPSYSNNSTGFRVVIKINSAAAATKSTTATTPAAASVPAPASPSETSASTMAGTSAASVNEVSEMVFFETKGQVTVIGEDGKATVGGVAVPQGPMITTLVTSGCVVKTGAASAADLALAGGGSIRLDADSELRLSEVASGSVSVERLELLKGRLFLCLEPANLAKGDRAELRLKTPSASVVIKEAKFYAEIGGAYETIAVFEGLAEITELKQSAKVVLKDDMAVAVKLGAISTPKRLLVSQVALNGNCREIELVRTAQTLLPDEETTIEDLYRFANSNSYVREEGHASFSQSEASKKALGGQVVRMAAYEPPNLAGRLVNFTPRVELRESKQPVVAIETCARSDGLNSLFARIEAYDASRGQFAFQIVPNTVSRDFKLDPGAASWGRLARKFFPLFGDTTSSVIKTVRPTFEIIFKGRNSCVIPGRKEYGLELTSIVLVTRK